MSKHTPGPWEVIGQHVFTKLGAANAHGSKASERDGWNIATINPWACTNQDEEEEDMPASETMANACLIASAPELLEALEDIASDYAERFDMDSPSTNPGMKVVVENARAAIAKARGES